MLRFTKCWAYTNIYRKYSQQINVNMKYLNVAEKNDAAKTIAGLLSNGTSTRREGYSVYNKIYDFETEVSGRKSKMVMTSVSGHLLQLEFVGIYRRWKEVDPQMLFTAPVQKTCQENFQPILRTLEREVRGCNGLIIWTDCDREGENIGYEIIGVCRKVKPCIKVYRAVFSEITKASVRRALNELKEPNKRLSDAVDVRTELDLRTGAAITRFQTMRLQRLFPEKIADKLISYGSCQIPTLGFVAERYKEIEAFVSEPFWKLRVLHTIGDLTVDFLWARNRLFDKVACEDYLLLCLADPKAKVIDVITKIKHKWRPTPLDTVEMEKLSSRKLKISAKETMTIAEKLYSKGIISYPRTETNQFSKDIDLRSLIEQFTAHPDWGTFAQRVNEWGPNPRNGNKSDQAHPPIHPTKLVTDLHGNDARIYELICRHFLACVSKDAVGSETVVNISVAGEMFTATGLCIHERNYLDIYIYEKWNAKQIHKYERGQLFEPTEISMQEGATTAPPLLTEADLIALMEKHGIGTDATHAEHINTIKERGYIGVVDKGCLVPGVIGMGLYEGYDAMNLTLAKPMLRAEFESDLKDVCTGKKDPKVVLDEQIQKYLEAYTQITEKVTSMDNKIALRINENPTTNDNRKDNNVKNQYITNNSITELFQCPKCSMAPLTLRQKKSNKGHFIGCMNFPDCKNAIWLPEECVEPKILPESCQHCGPNVKLIKFKFNSLYYKNIFNAPTGWYTSCLRCDQHLRDLFNINLEQVKSTGGIVGIIDDAITPAGVLPLVSPRNLNINRASESSVNILKKRNMSKPKVVSGTKKDSKNKNTNIQSTHKNIRTFFTSALNNEHSKRLERLDNAAVSDAVLDEFFGSDDDFDEIISKVDIQNENRANMQAARIDSLFTEEEDYVFTENYATATRYGNNIDLNFDNNIPDLQDFPWGTGEYKRSTMNKCSGCNQKAKECTVKKEGPNKGKLFYVCAKANPCNFFQWDDDVDVARHTCLHVDSLPKCPLQIESIKCSCGIAVSSTYFFWKQQTLLKSIQYFFRKVCLQIFADCIQQRDVDCQPVVFFATFACCLPAVNSWFHFVNFQFCRHFFRF
ncbi:DNA topoisomerase 3-alpha isoform X2 [Bactrocera neohumeralis]|uniref:DNA topoisomerase 3-alpha isoform X2 n=1 Tax=Bactrocera neohumeralis TaxID=98809 RepID=UPI0021666A4B|nr:DNA topoisomerase 3-alpha isoform X2 [Bactrocera neohumeralis]